MLLSDIAPTARLKRAAVQDLDGPNRSWVSYAGWPTGLVLEMVESQLRILAYLDEVAVGIALVQKTFAGARGGNSGRLILVHSTGKRLFQTGGSVTRTWNARIAGFTFLLYIVVGITAMFLQRQAIAGTDSAFKLAAIAQHEPTMRVLLLLDLVQAFCAIVLGVTLYGLTRAQDHDIAMMGLVCRVIEGIIASFTVPQTLALLWLAKLSGDAADTAAAHLLAAYLMRGGVAFIATFFAVGSACFAYLLLRGRMIPAVLAWVGVVASLLLVICLPLQLAGVLSGPATMYVWIPMIFFEVPLGFWWVIKGDTWTGRPQAVAVAS